MRDYQTLHLYINESKGTGLLLLSYISSHSRVFNNKNSSFTKLNVKWNLAYS